MKKFLKFQGFLAWVLFFSFEASAQVCVSPDVASFLEVEAGSLSVSFSESLELTWDPEQEQYLGQFELNPRTVDGAKITCRVFSNAVGVIAGNRNYVVTTVVDLTKKYFLFPTNKYFFEFDNGAYLVCAANDLYAYAYGQMKISDLEETMGHGFQFHWQGRPSTRDSKCSSKKSSQPIRGGCCRPK